MGIIKSGIFIRVFDVTGPVIKAMYCSMVGCRHFLEINPSWSKEVFLKYAILLNPFAEENPDFYCNWKTEGKFIEDVVKNRSKEFISIQTY